jgi:GT2 family glycosyltransferase
VVDDGSSDETERALIQVGGLHYHRRSQNGGFIAACNDGAALASGDFLVFLNNDTLPQPGWLDALLATFDRHPRTGLVGAQLIYPDGRLQEAGGLVFADGNAHNLGRFESPQRSALLARARRRLLFRRRDRHPAPRCSRRWAASTRAMRRRTYEDTDLGFAVARRLARAVPACLAAWCTWKA